MNWWFCDTAKIKPAKIIRDSLNNGTLTSITNFFPPTPLSPNIFDRQISQLLYGMCGTRGLTASDGS